MSKARQLARAERERTAAAAATAAREQQARDAAARTRRERRALAWRQVRVWQHGPAFRRNRERWGALVALLLACLLLVYLFTRSITAVIAGAFFLAIVTPVLVLLFFDRRNP